MKVSKDIKNWEHTLNVKSLNLGKNIQLQIL